MAMKFFSIFLLLPAAFAVSMASDPGIVQSEFIYVTAPFPECHASTLVETPQGMVVAWFGGTREKHPDVGIWLSLQHEGKWSAPREVADGRVGEGIRHPCWNPVLFKPRNGEGLWLFYKVGPSPERWWGMSKTSTDDGSHWSEARRLPDSILGPIKNKPIQLANGDILSPGSTEDSGWRVHFERSPDNGQTWIKIGPVNDGKEFDAIQPCMLLHPNGRLQALGRTRQGTIFQIWSEDGGKTWGKMRKTQLPNPNAGIDAVTLRDGRHLLVYNHTNKGRTPLNVAISPDGENWSAAAVLESEPGEYSYPAVIQAADGRVHITYTWKRQRIRHVVLDPSALTVREISRGIWPK